MRLHPRYAPLIVDGPFDLPMVIDGPCEVEQLDYVIEHFAPRSSACLPTRSSRRFAAPSVITGTRRSGRRALGGNANEKQSSRRCLSIGALAPQCGSARLRVE